MKSYGIPNQRQQKYCHGKELHQIELEVTSRELELKIVTF